MATTGFAASWLLLLLAGGFGALPLAGSPLPLDPVLGAVAPPECIWYASLSGSGPADASSSNQTEQLLAEPQVQRFFQEIESQVMKAIDRAGAQGPHAQARAREIPTLVKLVVTRPFAAFVEDVAADGESIDVSAALVVNAGDQRQAAESAMDALWKLDSDKQAKLKTESFGGVQWSRLPQKPNTPAVRFGWKDDYFIIAVGEKTAGEVLERMSGEAPQWLSDIRAEHAVPREMSIGYLNVAKILEVARPHMDAKSPELASNLEKLGLTSVVAVHGVAGYDADAVVSRAHIVTKGRPGALGFLPHKPLVEDDLRAVPKDAMIALAIRMSASELMDAVIDLASEFDPRARDQAREGLANIEQHTGIDVRRDILDSLDEGWIAYLPSGDLMTGWMNAAAGVRVKNASQLNIAMTKLVSQVKSELARGNGAAKVSESKFGEHTLYSVQFTGQPAPVSPSWCAGSDWLVVGLSPQAVRMAVERNAEDSLATTETVAAALQNGNGPAALAYQDTPQLVRAIYPWLQMGLQMGGAQLRQQGVDIDMSLLPSLEVIVKHLRPGVATLHAAEDGFRITSHHSLPSQANLATAAPMVFALGLPAISSARVAAHNAQDINNLKQIALAFHNYHDAHGSFPTDICDDDGNPLLSWRVRLIPYLEQGGGTQLYEQFRLDEPWDSEHNRQLLGAAPAVFASNIPGATTKTRMLAVAGEGTLFPGGEEELSFKHVTDGTSNTLAFVQASPDKAVEWTKPGDWEPDMDQPFEGLDDGDGHFIAGFCDGSVRRLSTSMGEEAMKAIISRGGDEVVDREAVFSGR